MENGEKNESLSTSENEALKSCLCLICGKRFQKPAHLLRHEVVHTKEKQFECSICQLKFTQKSSMQRHILRKHRHHEKTIVEDVDDVARSALEALKFLQNDMAEIVDRGDSTIVKTMPESTIIENKASAIKDRLHPDGIEKTGDAQSVFRADGRHYYVCEFCAKEFCKTYELIRHRRSHTKECPYKCNLCIKRYKTLTKLNEHKKMHEKQMLKQPKADEELKVLKHILPAPVEFEKNYEYLVRTLQKTPRLFKCVYCFRIFKSKYNCRKHMLTHLKHLLDGKRKQRHSSTAVDSFLSIDKKEVQAVSSKCTCTYCGKQFKKPSDLARHLRTHTRNKPFECIECKRCFALKSTLADHQKTHQEKRKTYNCQVCGKPYSSKKVLTIHLRLHTGVRPFKCENCEQTFRTSGHKISHMRATTFHSNKHVFQKHHTFVI